MTHEQKNVKIVAFVGLSGSGKTTAVEYLTQKGIPKVNGENTIDQINNLVSAGQHKIVTGTNYSWEVYKKIKHEFPGELHVIALFTPKYIRHHRLQHRTDRPLTEAEAGQLDWHEIEDLNVGGAIALADHFIVNDGNIEELHEQINQTLENNGFFN